MRKIVKLVKEGDKTLLVFPQEISEAFGFNDETIVDVTVEGRRLRIVPLNTEKKEPTKIIDELTQELPEKYRAILDRLSNDKKDSK